MRGGLPAKALDRLPRVDYLWCVDADQADAFDSGILHLHVDRVAVHDPHDGCRRLSHLSRGPIGHGKREQETKGKIGQLPRHGAVIDPR